MSDNPRGLEGHRHQPRLSRRACAGQTVLQRARPVHRADPAKFGTHSLRRTKAVLIYRRTGNLRAVPLLLGHSKIESTVRYVGIEVDDAIKIVETIDI